LQKVITDDLDTLIGIFPPHVQQTLRLQEDIRELLEVILDLGRPPEARFPQREMVLSPRELTEQDIEYVVSRIGNFGDDNRAGIARTLHRISAIRNRGGRIVGLTCRVGRAVSGTIKVIEDLIESGKSVMLLGRPGVGKTTMLREVARVLADDIKKRVIIVDTSNEIAGDGDIPHPAIGHARRMQVTTPSNQHAVMIEAVENHMPEVIVIDEMGTELEAQAARTIAERGVQLIGTAHGNTLENLIMNPTLSDLIGGIQSVTLGDEEAKRRGTQKSILERTSSPTFDIVIEIQGWDKVAIHPDVGEAVDAILRGQPLPTEIRWVDETGEVKIERVAPAATPSKTRGGKQPAKAKEGSRQKLYLFGVNRGRFEQMTKDAAAGVSVVDNLAEANLFVTSKHHYRRKPQKVREAETANIPVYVLRSSTPVQIRQFLNSINHHPETMAVTADRADSFNVALNEAQDAVNLIKEGEETVELSPQSAYIRRLQHLIAERNDLSSQSTGKEPQRRVRIFKG
jgi:stage III sporulation protein SpoIIIAA